MSMKSPSSVHSATSSARSSTSRRDRPAARPPRMMFSRPDRFLLKPTPSARSVLARPHTSIDPLVGGKMPAIARIRVDLPAPLDPMMPIAVPVRTSKETCLIASTSLTARCPRPKRTNACFNVGLRSKVVRYVMERSSTLTASGSSPSDTWPLDKTDCKLTLPRDEVQESDHRGDDRPHRCGYPHVGRRECVVLQQFGVPADHRIHRVE